MAHWPLFKDRRKSKRHVVDWQGTLRCHLADTGEDALLPVEVVNVSSRGACLAVRRLQVGSVHLVIGERDLTLELSVPLETGTFVSNLEIACYNWCDDTRRFLLNTVFLDMSDNSGTLLRNMLNTL